MKKCITKCPHCDGKIEIADIFRGDPNFTKKKCGVCGRFVTKRQLFSKVAKGVYHESNSTYHRNRVKEKLKANKNWKEKFGDLLGGEYDVREG